MASHTVFLGALIRHPPGMGLVTFLALHTNDLYVEVMFPHIKDDLMAIETISPVRPDGFVRFMALVTIKLHRCSGRDINLYRPLNSRLPRLIMPDIQGSIGYQFFSDFFSAMAEKTLLSSGSEVL